MIRFKFLLIAFAPVCATHAATLSMSLADLDLPNRSAIIDVNVDLVSGDTLSGVYFSLEPDPNVIHVSNSTDIPNWDPIQAGTNYPLGLSQFNVTAFDPINDALFGAGSFTVGSFELQLPTDLTNFSLELAFSATANNQMVMQDGQFYTFTTIPGYLAYSGYFTYGTGNPGITQMANSAPRDPLLITPEPAGLVFLAIAAIALIARR